MDLRASLMAAACIVSQPLAAQTPAPQTLATQKPAEFYAGKQIVMLVGATPGGGYDTQGRFVARHLSRRLPGNPAVIVQNMPAAGSLAATNHIYNTAPRDGTMIALVQRGMLLIRHWSPEQVRFELGKLNWIGSISREVGVASAWHTTPIKRGQDLFDQELIVGGVTGIDPETTPRLLNALIGTNFKIVNGYPGTTEIVLAMERGEVQGIGDWSWSSMKSARPAWIRERKLTLLFQVALQRDPELSEVPFALDFVRGEAERKVMELFLTQKTAARPLVAPPGVPADRIAALRETFAALADDPEFIADAQRSKLDIAPVSGTEVDKVVALINAASPETVQRLGKEIFAGK